MKETFTIVLMHANGERRTVPVEHVANTYISIRWGQSGIYDLNLKANVLTARSLKAQQKGGKSQWKAEDIDAVRKMVRDHFIGETELVKRQEAIKKHEASVPAGKPELLGDILKRSMPQ